MSAAKKVPKLKIPTVLPGYSSRSARTDRGNEIKGYFNYKNGYAVHVQRPKTERSASPVSATSSPKPGRSLTSPARSPKWLEFDKKVLRYYCYFLETVHESNIENFRVRRCTLCYYLEDDTISINEDFQANSGMPHGNLVKRHRLPLPKDVKGLLGGRKFYEKDDIEIGKDLEIYARTYRIVDCDAFTRKFMGIEAEAQPYPEDLYTSYREMAMARESGTDESIDRRKKLYPLKKHMEVGLTNAAPRFRDGDTLKKFLESDGKVLSFEAKWNEGANGAVSWIRCSIKYFIVDDSIQIVNLNKSQFPLLLKRQKVPKGGPATNSSATDQPYLTWRDFRVGKSFRLLGRDVLLCDCDSATNAFYISKMGLDQKANAIAAEEIRSGAEAVAARKIPPYNGFGSEEDSLQSAVYLVPRVPKKNFVKMNKLDGKILRFAAKMLNGRQYHAEERAFIVAYYLMDDTISVYEHPQRNSGIVSGKFLQRGKVAKPDGSGNYKAADLHVGARVDFNRWIFELQSADDFTIAYIEGHPNEFPKASLAFILSEFRRIVRMRRTDVFKAFRDIDKDHSGFITVDELALILHGLGLETTEHQRITMMHKYDKNGDGQISYHEFCAGVLREDYGDEAGEVISKGLRVVGDSSGPNPEEAAKYKEKLLAAQLSSAEEEKVELAIKNFMAVIRSKGKEAVRKIFLRYDLDRSGTLEKDEFCAALGKDGLLLGDDDIAILAKKCMPAGEAQMVSYDGFLQFVNAQRKTEFTQHREDSTSFA